MAYQGVPFLGADHHPRICRLLVWRFVYLPIEVPELQAALAVTRTSKQLAIFPIHMQAVDATSVTPGAVQRRPVACVPNLDLLFATTSKSFSSKICCQSPDSTAMRDKFFLHLCCSHGP